MRVVVSPSHESAFHNHNFLTRAQQNASKHLEGRQPEGVTAVLDAESAEKVAVHGEHDKTPGESSDTLSTRVCHTRDLESERDGCECENGV
jgi:hypothetical protein